MRDYVGEANAKRLQGERCEEQGHVWENGLTALFQFVLICKYCGAQR